MSIDQIRFPVHISICQLCFISMHCLAVRVNVKVISEANVIYVRTTMVILEMGRFK